MAEPPPGCPDEARNDGASGAAAGGARASAAGASAAGASRAEAAEASDADASARAPDPDSARGRARDRGLGALVGRALALAGRLRERLIGLVVPEAEVAARALALRRAYWTFDPDDKARLVAREHLSWAETLRLFHLACLEVVAQRSAGAGSSPSAAVGEGGAEGAGAGAEGAGAGAEGAGAGTGTGMLVGAAADRSVPDLAPRDLAPEGEPLELARDLAERLLEPRSPYVPRALTIWKRGGGPLPRPADLEGRFRNASITHLGALEVLRLDGRGLPRELAFVALSDLAGMELGEPARLRAACLHYEAPRERPEVGSQASLASEVVLLPTWYGIEEPATERNSERKPAGASAAAGASGSAEALRLIACFDDALPPRGIGVGRQALIREGGGAGGGTASDSGSGTAAGGGARAPDGPPLIHLDELEGLLVTVDLDDPRFDVKCRTRGVDPRDVREALVFGKKPRG